MAVVAQLVFEMAANVARLQSDMAKANSVVTGTMTDIKSAAGIAAKALGAVGIALGVREFADMIKGSAEAIEHLRDLAIKTGNTVEAIGALRPAVKAAGGDLDQMARGLGFLAKNMLNAADTGKGPAKAAFDELGIAIQDVNGKLRPTADIVQEVAEKLIDMEDKTRAAALAKVLLGKAGQDLLPVLEEMTRLGQQHSSVTAEQAEQAHQFMVNLRMLEGQSAALKREFTIGLLPALNSVTQAFLETHGEADAAREAGEAFGTVVRWASEIVYGFWTALQLAGKSLATMLATMDALKRGNFREALNVFREGMTDISNTAAQAGDRIRRMGEEAQKLPDVRKGRPAAGGGRRGAGNVGTAGTGVGDEDDVADEAAGGYEAPAAEQLTGGGGGRGSGLAPLLVQSKTLDKVLKDASRSGNDIGQVLERAGARGARGLEGVKTVLRDIVTQMLQIGAKNLAGTIGSTISGGVSSAVGSGLGSYFSGFFAGGGNIPAGGVGVVGEAGPELVSGPANVTPLSALRSAGGGGGGGGGDVQISGGDTNVHQSFTINIDMRAASSGAQMQIAQLRAQLPGMIQQHSLGALQAFFARRGVSMA